MMFDTMTMTKAVGAICGALLFFLLGNWAAESLYHVGGGHGDHEQAYVIDTGEEEVAEAPEEEGPDFATVFASADAAAGEKSWSKCRACHALEEGKNGVGPYLTGVMGRDVASVEGYAYSDALQGLDGAWTATAMNGWLEDPKAYAPGNKMGFAGIGDIEERANLIAFLGENSPGWEPELAAATEEEAEDASAEGSSGEAQAESDGEGSTEDAQASSEGTDEQDAAEETPAPTEESGEDAATEEGSAGQDTETTEEAPEQGSEAEAETDSDAGDATASGGDDEQSAIAAAYAQADISNGQSVFRQCAACHVADKEQNRVGPHLVNILDREIASVDGYAYSNALKGLEGDWTLEELDGWLEAPMQYAKGTKMGFMGVKDQQARADVIAYIESLNE